MLKRWYLKNFKAYRDLEPIEFSQINVLAGANSSGKSSIIQSILLLKQTLQYGSENRPITLNGPLLRLGGYEDISNFQADGLPLQIGFDFNLDENSFQSHWAQSLRDLKADSEASPRVISVKLSYQKKSSSPDLPFPQRPPNLLPELTRSELSVSGGEGEAEVGDLFVTLDKNLDGDPARSSRFYHANMDGLTRKEVEGDKPDAHIKHCIPSFFLPYWFVVEFNRAALRAKQVVDGIFSPYFIAYDHSSASIPAYIVEHINKWLAEHNEDPIEIEGDSVPSSIIGKKFEPIAYKSYSRKGSLSFLLNQLPIADKTLSADLEQLKRFVADALVSATEPDISIELENAKSLSSSYEFLREFFKDGVRYLGPLRDNPRPVYQLDALESTTDIGYRGEHTAAILDLNRGGFVNYHKPPRHSADDDYVSSAQSAWNTLNEAVVDWLRYLEVADDVITTDSGVFGHRLQVSTDGNDQLHDLTNVGVGVSQVLPIVVMALIAPKGSFLIFEQPELHLHPKVQARLADFFLSLAMDGKQTLLETHSEYLIDRLRLRIALSLDDKILGMVRILFSEKKGGVSSLTPVEINDYGAIANWPRDFFEQSQKDVGRIVRAALKKRRSKFPSQGK